MLTFLETSLVANGAYKQLFATWDRQTSPFRSMPAASIPDLRRAALHESSHCVAYIALWNEYEGIEHLLIRADGSGEFVSQDPTSATEKERLLVSACGPAGDTLHQIAAHGHGRFEPKYNSYHHDRDIISKLIGRTVGDVEWDGAIRAAEVVVATHRRPIKALADALYERRELSREDIRAILYPVMWS
jgi:hypothetical protein